MAALEDLKAKLEEERERLREEINRLKTGGPGASLGVLGDDADRGSHMADDASETFEQGKALAIEQHLRGLLGAVEDALRKFELGTYGKCDECGGEIAVARLEALPHANLCIACKTKLERRR